MYITDGRTEVPVDARVLLPSLALQWLAAKRALARVSDIVFLTYYSHYISYLTLAPSRYVNFCNFT